MRGKQIKLINSDISREFVPRLKLSYFINWVPKSKSLCYDGQFPGGY